MKKVLVIDVAAEYGGAITVLNSFYRESLQFPEVCWTYLVSKDIFRTDYCDNINSVVLPWVKKSWFHRLFFETIYLSKYLKKNHYDVIVSLQNTLLVATAPNSRSYILVHHPVQFYNGWLSPFNIEGLKMIARKHVVGRLIQFSVKRSNFVFAQTSWMRDRIAQWKPHHLILMVKMDDDLSDTSSRSFNGKMWSGNFLYPAHPGYVKNHEFIIRMLLLMKSERLPLPKILFTIDPNSNHTARRLFQKAKKLELPIEFIGVLDHTELMSLLENHVIVFPSKIETFGLPLLEARLRGTPILAIRQPYAMEVLDGYDRVSYFRDIKEAKELMVQLMRNGFMDLPNKKIHYQSNYNKTMIDYVLQTEET